MAGRYIGWHRVRGDTSDPLLRDLGRKLLADLDTRRRLGGIEQGALVQEITLSDGRHVRARFVGGQPIVEMSAPEAAQKPQSPAGFLGFVVRPSPEAGQSANADLNHALLAFASDGWTPVFYDETYVPDPPPEGVKRYSRVYPDGLLRQGNVDWRGPHERLVVSWMGPACRYFRRYAPETPYVFYAGRMVVDLSVFELDLLEDTGFVVVGACLRKNRMLVVAAKGEAPTAREVLLSIPMRPPAAERMVPPEHGAPTRLDPDYLGAEILGEWVRDRGTLWEEHPWFFNSIGTEARTLRQDTNGPVMEYVLAFDDDGVPVVSQITHAIQQDVTESADESYLPYYTRYHDNDYGESGGAWAIQEKWTSSTFFDESIGTNSVTIASHSSSRSNSGPARAPVAVDYRDDVPVYAEAYLRRQTDTLTYSKSVSGDSDVTYNSLSGEPYPTPNTANVSFSCGYTASSTYHRERIKQLGLWTDFLDLPATEVLTDDWTASSSETGSGGIAAYDPGSGVDFFTQAGNPNGSVTVDATQTVATAITTPYVIAMDLRSRSIAYALQILSSEEEQTWACAETPPLTGAAAEPAVEAMRDIGVGLANITHAATTTSQTTLRYRVVVDGAEVHAPDDIAYTSDASSSSGSIAFSATAASNLYGAEIGHWAWYIPLLGADNFRAHPDYPAPGWDGVMLDADPLAPHPSAPPGSATDLPTDVDSFTDDTLEIPQPHGNLLLSGAFARPMDHYNLLGAYGGHGDLQTLAQRWCFCIPVLQPAGEVPAVSYIAYAGRIVDEAVESTPISAITATDTARYDPVWVIGRTHKI